MAVQFKVEEKAGLTTALEREMWVNMKGYQTAHICSSWKKILRKQCVQRQLELELF